VTLKFGFIPKSMTEVFGWI